MLQLENLDLLLNDAGAPGFEILYWIIANPFYILPGLHGEVYLQSTGHHPSTRDQVSDPFSVALSLMIGVKLMHIDSSVGGVVVADTVCSLRRRLTIVLTKESQIWILFSTWDFCSILRYVWWSSNGRTGWGRLHLHTEDVGSFGSWGYVILICIDVWHLWIPFQRGTHHWRNLVGFVAIVARHF